MKTKEDLMAMKVDELRKLATLNGIKNCKKYKKVELVDVIFEALSAQEAKEVSSREDKKKHYFDNLEVGTLVAFTLPNGKTKSAKIVRIASKVKKVKVQTDYNAEYIVPYDSIIWVKTGKRWPRGVYNLLKGVKENG